MGEKQSQQPLEARQGASEAPQTMQEILSKSFELLKGVGTQIDQYIQVERPGIYTQLHQSHPDDRAVFEPQSHAQDVELGDIVNRRAALEAELKRLAA